METGIWKYHLLAFVIVALWGTTFISTRILLDFGMTPQEIFLVRFAMSYVGIWAVSPRRLWCDNWKDEAWMVLLGLTICLCVPLWLLVGFSGVEGFFPALWELLPQIPQMFSEIIRREEMKYLWVSLVNIPAGFLAEIVVLMLSVTIGSVIAKKHKILAAVGCYYGINLVISFVSGICSLAMAFAAEVNAGWIMGLFGSNAVLLLIVAVAGYFLMHFLADKKLNLT